MYDLRLARLLLLPSFLSGVLVAGLAVLIIGYSSWLYLDQNQLFYDYLFGIHGLKTYLWQYSQDAASWHTALVGSSFAYYALVGAAASVAGLVVYFLLQLLGLASRAVNGIRGTWYSSNKTSKAIAGELFARLILRIVSLVSWGIYSAFFVSTLIPFTLALKRIGIDMLRDSRPIGWLSYVAALLLLILSFHLHVVFMRLVTLRPRVVGGNSAIEEAEAVADTRDVRE